VRVIFVRHGETEYNVESRYQGHTDTNLSEAGLQQAAAVAARLRHESIAAIYTSDLSRASETARAIASYHGLTVKSDQSLRECAFGEWEGLTVTQIAERYPEIFRNYLRDSVTHRAPGGERLEQLQDRVVCAIGRLAEMHPDDTVVVVTHGGPIRAFFCYAFDVRLETFRRIRLDNCSLTTFSLGSDGRWFLEVLNDVCHLDEGEPEEQTQYMSSDA
jgi:alpha-ribazole phosphatase